MWAIKEERKEKAYKMMFNRALLTIQVAIRGYNKKRWANKGLGFKTT